MFQNKRTLGVPGDTPNEIRAKKAAQKYYEGLIELCGDVLSDNDLQRDASRYWDGYLACLNDQCYWDDYLACLNDQ